MSKKIESRLESNGNASMPELECLSVGFLGAEVDTSRASDDPVENIERSQQLLAELGILIDQLLNRVH